MHNLQNLEFIQVVPERDGLSAYASYPGWYYRYAFFVHNNGTVKGKTSSGYWQDLSGETASIIRAKIHTLLKGDNKVPTEDNAW